MKKGYKYSGIDWLGDIPDNWETIRLKDLGSLQNGVSKGKDYFGFGYPFVSYGNVYNDKIDIQFIDGLANSTKEEQKLYSILEGDVFFTRTSETIDEIGISATALKEIKNATFSGFLIRLRPSKKKIIKEYSNFFFKAHIVRLFLSKEINLVTRASLSQSVLSNLLVLLPNKTEQKIISLYLENKIRTINHKITLLEQKITHYQHLRKSLINETVCRGLNKNVKLKDSGIEWLGMIPEHWEVKRFKNVVLKYTTGGTPSTSNDEYFNGKNTWICISDINNSKYVSESKIKLTDEAIKSATIIKTPKGSLLYSFKLSIGKMAFVETDVYTNEAILSIFPNKNIDLEYYYFMLPQFMLLAATENIYGAKMLNQKLIANAFVLHPPKEEQTTIAQYLDEKTQKIDSIINNIKTRIEKLKELRKTLINDVATGKIKVS